MTRDRNFLGALLATVVLTMHPAASRAQSMFNSAASHAPAVRPTVTLPASQEIRHEINDISVSIMVSGMTCTCARFAEDIRNVVNDLRPNGIRVLPVLGVGGLQNLKDILFMKGIDLAVVDQDNVRLLKQRDPILYANIEQRIQYVTKLYTAEFHVLARNNIKSYSDLKGQKVNFNLKDSQTDVTADRVFGMLNLPVERSYYDNDEAVQKLLKGEISAMIILTGGPQAALAKLKAEDGVHFLPLDQASLPDRDVSKVLGEYPTVQLTSKLYPHLIPEGVSIPTIANYALLVAYNWPENSERYRRLSRFVNEFFGKIDQLQNGARHPKWAEFNPAFEMPGWTRFKPAAVWLAQHSETAMASVAPMQAQAAVDEATDMRTDVTRVLESYQSANGSKPMTPAEKELVKQIKQLLEKQKSQAASRQVAR